MEAGEWGAGGEDTVQWDTKATGGRQKTLFLALVQPRLFVRLRASLSAFSSSFDEYFWSTNSVQIER